MNEIAECRDIVNRMFRVERLKSIILSDCKKETINNYKGRGMESIESMTIF